MHQYLFFIGDFPIRMYGLMLCTAIFLATGTAYFLAKQDGRWHEHILDIGIYGGFAGSSAAGCGMFSSSTGITTVIIFWKSPSSGREAWPCRAVCWQALLPALFTASCITSTG